MTGKIRAGVVGGAGYTGGELCRLLLQHPGVELVAVSSKSNTGKPLYEVHADLFGESTMIFCTEDYISAFHPDVLFLCLGHGASRKFLEQYPIDDQVRIIDLSQDFRWREQAEFKGRRFVYGLPELNKPAIKNAQAIANPGCFATAIQLSLLPLAAQGLIGDVYTTGITGSTGAGQSLSDTSHFSWRSNNISAYKSLAHQHITEISQSLHQLKTKLDPDAQETEGAGLWFVPWRGDFARGIFTSSTISSALSLSAMVKLFEDFYQGCPFTHVAHCMIDMKQVLQTNKCLLYIEQQDGKTVIHSTIDNLLKGASGQAVQNMNLMFGLDERAGLRLKAAAF